MNDNYLLDKFIVRKTIGNGIIDEKSITRALYFIEIAIRIKKKYNYKNIWLILISRPWETVFDDYKNEMKNFFLYRTFSIKNIKSFILNKIFNFKFLHLILFNLKLLRQQIKISRNKKIHNNTNNLYNVSAGILILIIMD